MIGGVIRHILPHLPGIPHLHVKRPLGLVPKNSIPGEFTCIWIFKRVDAVWDEFAVGSFKRSAPRVFSPGIPVILSPQKPIL